MSFRVVTIPLRERTKNDAKLGELVVDNNYGDISVFNSVNFKDPESEEEMIIKHENKESSTKKIEGELQSIQIRKDLVEEELDNDLNRLGTFTVPKDFNIVSDRDDNLLASIRYIDEKYKKYINDGTVESYNVPGVVDKVYNISNPDSYSSILRNILYEILEGTDTSEIKSTSFNEIMNKLLISLGSDYPDSKGTIYDLRNSIRKLSELNDLLNSKIKLNNSTIDAAYSTMRRFLNLKDIVKTKKFIRYNGEIFDGDSKVIPDNMKTGTGIQTENESTFDISKYYLDQKDSTNDTYIYTNKNDDNAFIDHFVSNPLSKNFDGDNNLMMLDSVYYRDLYGENNPPSYLINDTSLGNDFILFGKSSMINANEYINPQSRLPIEYLDRSTTPKNVGVFLDNRYWDQKGFWNANRNYKVFMYSNYDKSKSLYRNDISEISAFHRAMNSDLINGLLLSYMVRYNGLSLYSDVYASYGGNIQAGMLDYSRYRYLKNNMVTTSIQLEYTYNSSNPIHKDAKDTSNYQTNLLNALENKLREENIDFFYTKYPNYMICYSFLRTIDENETDQSVIETNDKSLPVIPFNIHKNKNDFLYKDRIYNPYAASFNYYRGRSFINSKNDSIDDFRDMDIMSYNQSFLNYFELYLRTFDNLFNGSNTDINDGSNNLVRLFDFKKIHGLENGLNFKNASNETISGVKLIRSIRNGNNISIQGGYYKNSDDEHSFNFDSFSSDTVASGEDVTLSLNFIKPTWKDTMKRFILNNLGFYQVPNYDSNSQTTLLTALNRFDIDVNISLSNSDSKNGLLFKDLDDLY